MQSSAPKATDAPQHASQIAPNETAPRWKQIGPRAAYENRRHRKSPSAPQTQCREPALPVPQRPLPYPPRPLHTPSPNAASDPDRSPPHNSPAFPLPIPSLYARHPPRSPPLAAPVHPQLSSSNPVHPQIPPRALALAESPESPPQSLAAPPPLRSRHISKPHRHFPQPDSKRSGTAVRRVRSRELSIPEPAAQLPVPSPPRSRA